MTPESLLALWRAANARAYEAEDALFVATMAYLSGRAPVPAPELSERATAFRREASELLASAIRTVGVPATSFNRVDARHAPLPRPAPAPEARHAAAPPPIRTTRGGGAASEP